MPRGRPQRKGTRQRYKPTDRRPRETVTRATDDAGSGMTPMSTDEWPALPHPRRSTAMASRWDEGNAGNWSAVVLRQKIEARGLKLPASMKKAQMLNIFLDNFNDEDQAASSSSTTGTVGRNLWICEIHGSRCAIYGSLARAGIHGCLRNLWILRRVRSTDLTVLISTLP